MEGIFRDLAFGWRQMRRHKGVTAVAVLALAIGIGANTAIFSIVHSILLKPLPFGDPDRMVQIWGQNPARGVPFHYVTYPDFNRIREQSRSYDAIAAYRSVPMNLTGREQPEQILTLHVNAGFFDITTIKPLRGRTFSKEDDRPGAGRVIVLSHNCWRRLFGADPDLAGRLVRMNGDSYTVVGVMPAEFILGGSRIDGYVPLAASGDYRPASMSVTVAGYALLKPGITRKQAQAEVDLICRRLEREQAPGIRNIRLWGVREFLVRDIRTGLLILMGAVALVLLIACANVANILLARASARWKEMAVRTVLGASRTRLLRQMMTESMLLAGAGGVLGTVLAYLGVEVLVRTAGDSYPLVDTIRLDGRVLAVTALICTAAGFLAGLAPARAVSREGLPGFLHQSLKEGGRTSGGAYSGRRLRAGLVVSEVALASLLMMGAGLLMRSLIRLQDVDPGFGPERVLTGRITLPLTKYAQGPARRAFFQELIERLEALPDVASTGFVTMLPLSGSNTGVGILIQGRPEPPPAEIPIVWWRAASPGYFTAMSIPLLKGRLLGDSDREGAPAVAVINQTMAGRLWPGEDPIGKRFSFGRSPEGQQPTWLEVVGIVGGVRHTSLAQAPDAEFFLAAAQLPPTAAAVAVKTRSDPEAFVPMLRKVALAVDKDIPVSNIRSMEQIMSDSLDSRRLSVRMMAIFALAALVLSAIGVYGVVSYSVSQRRHEIGVRMAVGARAGQVVRMTIARGMAPVLLGLGLGTGGAIALGRVLRSQLFETDPLDPVTYAWGIAILLAVSVTAAIAPACRAARIDTIAALHGD